MTMKAFSEWKEGHPEEKSGEIYLLQCQKVRGGFAPYLGVWNGNFWVDDYTREVIPNVVFYAEIVQPEPV